MAEGKTGNVFIENEIFASYFEFQIQAELIITTVANWVRIRKRYKCLLLYINIKTLPVSAKYFNFKNILLRGNLSLSLIVNFSVFINKGDC